MSNNKSNSNDKKKEDEGDSNVCRDFLRNVCRRGASCKYKHPERSGKQHSEYQFCHDYQNSECMRSNCKYIHCSRSEQEYYKETGKLPPALEDLVEKGLAGGGSDMLDGEIPVCRDYLKGECNRGSRCKFRHLSRGDLEYEERARRMAPPRFDPRYDFSRDPYGEYEYDRMRRRPLYDDYEPVPRSRERGPPCDRDMRELEDENVMLRRKIDELRKQVSDLTATNEVLLDQNARLRAAKVDNTTNLVKAETHLVRSTSSALPLLSHGNLLAQQAPGQATSTLLTQESPAALTDQIPGMAGSLATLAQAIPTVSIPSVQTSMISYPIVSNNIRPGLAGR